MEGFICPQCKVDLQSFQHLEAHCREEHGETSSSKFKTNFKSFLDKAKASLGKKPQFKPHVSIGGIDEGASAAPSGGAGGQGLSLVQAHVTNVSGIDLEAWPAQEFGEKTNYIEMHVNDI